MSTLDDFFAKKDRKKKGGKADGSRNERGETSGGKKEKTVDITDNFKYISDVSARRRPVVEWRSSDADDHRMITTNTRSNDD